MVLERLNVRVNHVRAGVSANRKFHHDNAPHLLRSERLTTVEWYRAAFPAVVQSLSGRDGFLPVPTTVDSLQRTPPRECTKVKAALTRCLKDVLGKDI